MISNQYSAVIGANGQDGFLMTRYLLKKNIKTLSITRKSSQKIKKLEKLKNKNLKVISIKKINKKNLLKIKKLKINKFYFFAGFSKIPENEIEKKNCKESNYEILKDFLIFFEKYYYRWRIKY